MLKSILTKKFIIQRLKEVAIKEINENFNGYDCILGEQFSVENYKLIKIIKKHFIKFLLNPTTLISKKKRTIKFHFDLFHGDGNLDLVIDLLDQKTKVISKNLFILKHLLILTICLFVRLNTYLNIMKLYSRG